MLMLGLVCGLWTGWWTRDLDPARYVVPPLSLVLVVLLARWPVRAGFGLLALLAAYPSMDVHVDNGSFLMPTLVACYVVGRTAAAWPGLVVIAGFNVALVLDDPTVPNALFGAFLLGGVWLFGTLIGRRTRAARIAGAEQASLEAEDEQSVVARVVSDERARLAADTVGVVREAVTQMRATAAAARPTLDPALLIAITERGDAAVADLRRLIGLLRTEPAAEHRGPVIRRRRPWVVDVVTALAAAAVTLAEIRFMPGMELHWVSVVFGVALGATLALRRTELATAVAVAIGVQSAGAAFGAVPVTGLGVMVVWVLLSWSVGSRGTRLAWLLFAAYGALALLLVHRADPGNVFLGSLFLVLPLLAGRAWSERDRAYERTRAETRALQARRDEAISRAVIEERLRIARELHDVTSHALGVMVLQAGAAHAQRTVNPDRARAALELVESAGRQAESELGVLLEVLEVPTLPETDLRGALTALVERMRAGGLDIAVDLGDLPTGPAGQTAYRAVQEALTNAARHAPGSRVAVHVGPGAVEVVSGPGRRARSAPGSGFGLVGLGERVRAVGGTLDAGPRPGGGYAVRVTLPGAERAGQEVAS
jgi:signal transduction histidine kinase